MKRKRGFNGTLPRDKLNATIGKAGLERQDFQEHMYEQSSLIIVVADMQGALVALRRAKEEGRALLLQGPERVAEIQGSAWFIKMVDQAKRLVPGVEVKVLIDAGACAGLAYDAIMRGADYVLFTGKASAARKLNDIAKQMGGQVLTKLGKKGKVSA